jgi:putative alpha-1,2-mannosidase
MSSEQACSHAESEIPNFNFQTTKQAAITQWEEKMKPIRVSREGVKSDVLTNFYSGIYRTMVNPQNYTGENPLWTSSEPYFDSFYWFVSSPSLQFTLLIM